MSKEIWADIEGYEDMYQVSSLGRLRCLDRYVMFPDNTTGGMKALLRKGHIMKPGSSPNGYRIASISRDAQVKYYAMHRLVAKAFIPNKDNLPQINHKNGNKQDNRVVNLEWCTPAYNQNHAIKLKLITHKRGESCSWSKLTRKQVEEIKSMLSTTSLSQKEIGRRFNVSAGTISNIKLNKTWL